MSLRPRRTLRSALSVLTIACAALALSACDPFGPGWQPAAGGRVAADPTPAARRMGIALDHMSTWATDADLARDLDAVVAAGATWVAVPVDWPSIEIRPGVYKWDENGEGGLDRTVRMARERGLEVYGTIAYSPVWARPAGCTSGKCPPVDPALYADFAGRVARRYAPQGVHTWQVWNEPNNFHAWSPKPDVAAYTRLLKAAYAAVKEADPVATVAAAGLSPAGTQPDGKRISPLDFLAGVYAEGGGGYFDVLAHHPYSFGGGSHPLDGHPLNAYTQTVFLHEIMAAHGDGGKEIWGSESGAPTGTAPDAGTEDRQAQLLDEYFRGWQGTLSFRRLEGGTGTADMPAFTGPLFTYEIRDAGTDITDREDNFGLLRRDGSPKPAFATFCRKAAGPACTVAGASGDPTPVVTEAPPPDDVTAPEPAPADLGLTVTSAGIGRAVAANPHGGYYVLAAGGRVAAYGGAPDFGAPDFGFDIARDIAVMPDGLGYVVLDGWGGLHRFGSARSLPKGSTGYWKGWDIARGVAVAPGGDGYAVLDGWGGVHGVGALRPTGLPYWKGWDIARSLAVTAAGEAYVLDGFGGVHAASGSPSVGALRGPYWNGRDIARDLIVSPGSTGLVVLDGYGAVHTRGDARPVSGGGIRDAAPKWRGIAVVGDTYTLVRDP